MSSPVLPKPGVSLRSPTDVQSRVRGAAPSDPGSRLLGRMLRALGNPPIELVLWDGRQICVCDAPPVARLLIRDRRTLLKLLIQPELHFGDAYSQKRIVVRGDLLDLLEAVYRARMRTKRPAGLFRRTCRRWLNRMRCATIAGSRANIHHHYDIGDDFYRLWLDGEMVYSCAYFDTPTATLEEAQTAKMNYVCRKLDLKSGQTVVEVGSGWGALALFMARHYRVNVKAFNISHPQILYSRRRAEEEGLDGRVEFIEDDYRNIRGRFDALVSLGMLEHVGAGNYRQFGRVVDRCLRPSGRGLIQTIGQNRPGEVSPWIDRRIFPGAYPPSPREMSEIFEPFGLSVLDAENLRLHYAETLRHWLARFESATDRVAEMFDRRFVRMWRLYLTGSAAAFATGSLQLFQVLFCRPGVNEIPRTRAGLYRAGTSPQ